jgi:hypothetical protein
MRRTIYAAALCGCVVVAGGWVSYEQHVTFENDGSGRMVLDWWVDDWVLSAMPPLRELGKEAVSAFTGLEGVTVEESWTEVEGEGPDEREHIRVVVAFDKVETLTGNHVFENGEFSFKKKGKEFAFTQVLKPHYGEEPEDFPGEGNEELVRDLLERFEDHTITFTVVMPGRVADTNGTVSEDGRTVTWAWSLYEVGLREEKKIMMTATSRKE